MGSTPFSFYTFIFYRGCIPNSYLSLLVVVRFWSLKKARSPWGRLSRLTKQVKEGKSPKLQITKLQKHMDLRPYAPAFRI